MDLTLLSLSVIDNSIVHCCCHRGCFSIDTCFFMLTDYPVFMNALSQYVKPGDI